MRCLIIAAGQGNRLRQRAESKPLAPILDTPLIERIIRRAAAGGVKQFSVVSGYQGARLRSFLDALSSRTGWPIQHVVNERWEEPNGLSVLAARDCLDQDFVLLMADHLFDPAILSGLIGAHRNGASLTLAVDNRLSNPYVDLVDVTRVLHEGGRIVDIGKGLARYNAYDTGIFYCTPDLFTALETSISENADASLSGGVRELARGGRARTYDIGAKFWLDVDDSRGFVRAEVALLEGEESNREEPVAQVVAS